MKNKFLILFLLVFPATMQAQLLNKIKNKVKSTIENRSVAEADKQVNKAIDEVEGKTPPSSGSNEQVAVPAPAKTNDSAITSYSRYDFVPGDTVLYAEDFSSEAIGESPVNWNSSGKGEVVTLSNQAGHWLKMFANTNYLTANTRTFSKNFTIEFDVLLQLKNTGSAYPVFTFGMLASDKLNTTDNELLGDFSKYQSAG